MALDAAASSTSVQEFADQGSWWTVGMTAGGAALGAGSGWLASWEPKTILYRSVSSAEAKSIASTGRFSLPAGGMESKQFGLSYAETRQFGTMMGQNTIVSARVPTSMMNPYYMGGVDPFLFKHGTVTVYGDQLDVFNRSIYGPVRFK
jgi:hypothetical protein